MLNLNYHFLYSCFSLIWLIFHCSEMGVGVLSQRYWFKVEQNTFRYKLHICRFFKTARHNCNSIVFFQIISSLYYIQVWNCFYVYTKSNIVLCIDVENTKYIKYTSLRYIYRVWVLLTIPFCLAPLIKFSIYTCSTLYAAFCKCDK